VNTYSHSSTVFAARRGGKKISLVTRQHSILLHHKEVIADPAGLLSVNRGRSFGIVPANGCLMQAAFASQLHFKCRLGLSRHLVKASGALDGLPIQGNMCAISAVSHLSLDDESRNESRIVRPHPVLNQRDLLAEKCFQYAQRFGRRSGRELGKVMDQVHLVVISELMRDIGPRLRRRSGLAIESRLKANDSCVQFGPHAKRGAKVALQLTLCEVCYRGGFW
jgi:hypothetical protein